MKFLLLYCTFFLHFTMQIGIREKKVKIFQILNKPFLFVLILYFPSEDFSAFCPFSTQLPLFMAILFFLNIRL